MERKGLQSVVLWAVVLTVVGLVLLVYESDLLWKVGRHNVFLFSSQFFEERMVVPGGFLSWTGGFFSQFFYYPWVGVVTLCGWWWLLMWLTKRAFNIPEKWIVLTVIPVAILLTANVCLGYWVYLIKLPGYFYVPTIGVTAGTALLWGFRLQGGSTWMGVVYIVVATIVCYPLMGIYALASVVLMGVMSLMQCRVQSSWTSQAAKPSASTSQAAKPSAQLIVTVVALLSVAVVPLIYYHFVYHETNIIYIYSTGLPAFSVSEEYPNYYIPYYALAVCELTLAVLSAQFFDERSGKAERLDEPSGRAERSVLGRGTAAKPQFTEQNKRKRTSALVNWILQGGILAATVGGVYYFWYKDANFHHELRMQRCVEQTDWEGVIEEGKKQDCQPTRAIVMMHNLALSRLGRQCEEMYKFRKGSAKPNTPLPVYMYQIAGRMMLYQYGMVNECHRICMEESVERGWNVEQLQYLARCAIINKEIQVARKYLDLLRQTLFYGEWADHAESLLNDPQMLVRDSETGPITHMLHYSDRLEAVEGWVEKFLMTSLAQHDADDIYFQEQAVLGALWTRDPDLFWPRMEHFVKLSDGYAPRIFQEAAWLFANLQGMEDIDQWELNREVKDSFTAFMQMMERYKKAPSNMMRNAIMARFGNTYYFEYFFLRNLTYY